EFGIGSALAARDLDLAVLPRETKGIPALPLAAEGAQPVPGPLIGREIISHPGFRLAEMLGIHDGRLLPQFAPGGSERVLVRVDAALRHLPFARGQDDLRPVIAQTA